jgi:hypothetical protein
VDPKQVHGDPLVLTSNFTISIIRILKKIFRKRWNVYETLDGGRKIACVPQIDESSHLLETWSVLFLRERMHPQSQNLHAQWSPLIQKFKNLPNTEVEIRLGRRSKTSFDTNVGKDTFDKVFRALMKYQGWETSRHSKATVYYFPNSRRLTVDEESDEQDGCTKTRVCTNDFRIDGASFDVRLGISTEEPWEYDGEEVSTEQKDKERWSFIRKNLSIDMTIVKGTPDDKDSDDDTIYQVELEIIRPADIDSDKGLFNILYKVFDILKCV